MEIVLLACSRPVHTNVNMSTMCNFFPVIEAFDVRNADGANNILILTDNVGAPIEIEKFTNTIKTFHRGGSFFVNVAYESTYAPESSVHVTPLVRFICEVIFLYSSNT